MASPAQSRRTINRQMIDRRCAGCAWLNAKAERPVKIVTIDRPRAACYMNGGKLSYGCSRLALLDFLILCCSTIARSSITKKMRAPLQAFQPRLIALLNRSSSVSRELDHNHDARDVTQGPDPIRTRFRVLTKLNKAAGDEAPRALWEQGSRATRLRQFCCAFFGRLRVGCLDVNGQSRTVTDVTQFSITEILL